MGTKSHRQNLLFDLVSPRSSLLISPLVSISWRGLLGGQLLDVLGVLASADISRSTDVHFWFLRISSVYPSTTLCGLAAYAAKLRPREQVTLQTQILLIIYVNVRASHRSYTSNLAISFSANIEILITVFSWFNHSAVIRSYLVCHGVVTKSQTMYGTTTTPWHCRGRWKTKGIPSLWRSKWPG